MSCPDDLLNKLAFNGFHISAAHNVRYSRLNLQLSNLKEFHDQFPGWDNTVFPSGWEFGKLLELEGYQDIRIVDNDGNCLFGE